MKIDPGRYQVKAKDFHFGHSKNGTECVTVSLEILDGPAKGSEILWDGWLTEKTQERTAESLVHLGWTGEDFAKLPGLGSKVASAEIADEEYNGKVSSRVKWINAQGGHARVAPEAMGGFAAKMEALAKGVLSGARGTPNGATAVSSPAAPAPKLPF